jgi:acyl transferase domain-containing protein
MSINSFSSAEQTVAIIGIGCRLPGGISDPRGLLSFLEAGADAAIEVPPERWALERYYNRNSAILGRTYVHRAGFVLQSPFDFDPDPFGISPREADHLDPQQRWLLEVTLEAFEDAAIPIDQMRATRTAVFIGGFTQDHQNLIYTEGNRHLIDTHTAVGASMTVLSNRISYTFDLRGPSVTVDTACSGSLVAVHLARQAILHEGCTMAIAGGVNVMLSPLTTIAMSKGHFLSPDGRSKAFDALADGYGRAEGAAVVILKRLDLARRDGNSIYAVIHATGTGQDGRTDGMPMPNGDAQRELIESVVAQSGLPPEAIAYVEAHGTGTRIGDPTEANAIGTAYAGRTRTRPLRIGSIKSNLGHLEACAGVTGLIKATLAVKSRTIIPQRLTSKLNPEIPFEQLGLKVALSEERWPTDGRAIAAVNSFGYGGTNAHAIVGAFELPDTEFESPTTPGPDVSVCVPLSAASRSSLQSYASALANALDDSDWLGQVRTLAVHRTHYSERAVVVAASSAQLRESLARIAIGICDDRSVMRKSLPDRRLLWIFTGMGPQWWAMGRQLYFSNQPYRDALTEVDGYFAALSGESLLDAMLANEATSRMNSNDVAQPANFALQVGLVALLRSLGVPCHGILGHSVGEVASAWASGSLSLRDATEVAFHRSRLQQTIAGSGTLLAVGVGLAQAQQLLAQFDGIEISAINSPRAVAFAGSKRDLDRLAERLELSNVFHRWLGVEVPYHSSHMDPLREQFLSRLAWLTPRPPQVPLFSTVRGGIAPSGIFDSAYFWQNARQPVRLNDALDAAIDAGFNAFLEIGPHPVLAASIKDVLAARDQAGETFYCQRRGAPDELTFLRAVAALHAYGLPIDWSMATPPRHPRPVPHYAFTRTRHWVESEQSERQRVGCAPTPSLLDQRDDGPNPRYRLDLASPRLDYLADHQVAGKTVLPAALYAVMSLEFALERSEEHTPVQLESLAFERVLVMPNDDPGILLMDVQSEQTELRFHHRRSSDDWIHHASARVAPFTAAHPDSAPSLAQLQREHITALDVGKLYDRFARSGLKYGPAFRRLGAVWTNPDGKGNSILARLTPGDDSRRHRALDPTVLDAAFQAVLALFDDADAASVPVQIAQLAFHASGTSPQWIHAKTQMANAGTVSADLNLLASDGSVVCSVTGLVCREIEDQRDRAHLLEQYYYREDWLESPVADALPQPPTSLLLVGTATPELEYLAATLSARRVHVTIVPPHHADPATLSQADHVLFYTSGAPTDAVGMNLCDQLTQLANRLSGPSARLYVVTNAAQRVLPSDRPEPKQATLWGLGRVIMTEHPELCCRLIDLGDSRKASLDRLCELLLDVTLEEESALRQGQLFCRRLRRHHASLTSAPSQPAFGPWHRDRTILVTGGLTGFGLTTADWLAKEGAQCIVLASRRGVPDPTAAAKIRHLQRRTRIECHALDVTSEQSLAQLLRDIATRMPPLGGIVHSAMVLDDVPLRNLTPDSLRAVMWPKALGAWLLHQQTRHMDLDLFILYSSVSALVGNPHQANYAAANCFLQALAERRISEGLVATCISWGALADVGAVARDPTLETYLQSLGLAPIPAHRALAAMRAALDFQMAHVGIIDADWNRWIATFPKTPWNRLSEVLHGADTLALPATDALNALKALEPDELRKELRQRVMQAVASVLRTNVDAIGPETELNRCGLDSLMAAELGRSIETSIGVVIGTMEILSNVSANDLVHICAERIERPCNDPSGAQPRAPEEPATEARIATTSSLLRDHVLAHICVQPPYFCLDDLAQDGDWVTATVSPLAPTAHERDCVSCAEVARHLSILGSCAVSLAHPHEGRVFYPIRTAHRPASSTRRRPLEEESVAPPLSTLNMRARCTEFDARSSRATAETAIVDATGRVDQTLTVEYHLIPEQQFANLFARYRQLTFEGVRPDPYRTWCPLPPVQQDGEGFSIDLGRVPPEQCLGHFVQYPAMPVSLMTRDAVRLVAECVRMLRGWPGAQVTVLHGGVTAHAFAFAGEPLRMHARRDEGDRVPLFERWHCLVTSFGTTIADIDLEVQIHPNLAVTAYPDPLASNLLTA